MSRIYSLVVILGFCGITIGCGQGGSPMVGGGGPVPSDPVARTVYEFLEAIRTGDTEGSSSRLTPLALERIDANDMIFAPPASEQARFQIGQVQMYAADKAFVATIWTDADADGVPTDEHTTWALRLTDGQWRICGMAAQMGSGQSPVVMDFENPEQFMNPSRQNATAGSPSQQQGSEAPRQASQPAQDPFR